MSCSGRLLQESDSITAAAFQDDKSAVALEDAHQSAHRLECILFKWQLSVHFASEV